MTLRATLFASCAFLSALASAAPTTVKVSGLEVADAASLVAEIELSTYSAPNWNLVDTMLVSAPLGADGKRHVTFSPKEMEGSPAAKVEIKLRKSNYTTSSYSPIEFYVTNSTDPSTYPSTRNTLAADCNGDFVVDLEDYLAVIAAFDTQFEGSGFDPAADIDSNEVVDLADYLIVTNDFNQAGSGAITPVVSHTYALFDELAAKIGSYIQSNPTSSVITVQLDGGFYAVQGRMSITNAASSSTFTYNRDQLLLTLPAGKSLVVNGNGSRIIHGVEVASSSLESVLPSDPLISRLSSAQLSNIKKLDLYKLNLVKTGSGAELNSAWPGADLAGQPWSGNWPKLDNSMTPANFSQYMAKDPKHEANRRQIPVVGVRSGSNYFPLRLASEKAEAGTPLGRNWSYATEKPANENTPTQLPTESASVFPFTQSANLNIAAVIFATSDYKPHIAEVSEITQGLNSKTIHLKSSIFSSKLANAPRFRMLNDPMHLDNDREFIFNNRDLYFIPESGTESVVVALPARLVPSQRLSSALADPNPNISNSIFDLTKCEGVTFTNLHFDTGVGSVVIADATKNLEITNCTFSNFGRQPVVSRRGNPNDIADFKHRLTVQGCVFGVSNSGHVLRDTSLNAETTTFDSKQFKEQAQQVIYDSSPNTTIKSNLFFGSGQLFSDAPSIEVARGANSVLIGGEPESDENIFNDTEGAAIRFNGTNIKVINNEFSSCGLAISDYGAVYSGRSLVDLGNEVSKNTFSDITVYPAQGSNYLTGCDHSPEMPSQFGLPDDHGQPGALFGGGTGGGTGGGPGGPNAEDQPTDLHHSCEKSGRGSMCAIYFDDCLSGQKAELNGFVNCDYGFIINGGRDTVLTNNEFVQSGYIQGFLPASGAKSDIIDGSKKYILNNEDYLQGRFPQDLSFSSILAYLRGEDNQLVGSTGLVELNRGIDAEALFNSTAWGLIDISPIRFKQGDPPLLPTSTPTESFWKRAKTPKSFTLASGQVSDSGFNSLSKGWLDLGWIRLRRNLDASASTSVDSTWQFRSVGNQFYAGLTPESKMGTPTDATRWCTLKFTSANGTPLDGINGFTRDYGEEMLQVHIEGEPLNGTGVAARPKRLRLGVMDQLGRFSFRLPSGSETKRLWVRAPGTLWTEIPVGTHSFSTSVNMVYGDINADNMITIDPQQSGSDRFLFDLAVGAKVQMQLTTLPEKSPYFYSEVADLNRDNLVGADDRFSAGPLGANIYLNAVSGAILL